VLKALRARKLDTPILVLTARDAVPDRVMGLDTGADDYVVKPVDLIELAARLRSLVRRSVGQFQDTLRCGPVELDPAARRVTCQNEVVALSTREYDLLHALLRSAGRVLTREQLEQQMYSWGHEVESNTIEVHIHHLRRKLGAEVIHTVRGVGYTVQRESPAA
jgi:two-component system OmpR family response regulator/two-component system response regulator QseB